jgi:adenylate cyclase
MRKALAGVILGLGAAVILLALAAAGAFDIAELKSYDWRVRMTADPASAHPDIALVLIDDQTLRDMYPALGRWPWPRVGHALLFEFLSRGPAKVVAFDIGLSEPDIKTSSILGVEWTGAESDKELADAVRRSGNVIVLGDVVIAGVPDQLNKPAEWKAPRYRLGPAIEARPMLLAPYQAVTDAAVGIGHNFLPLDSDGPTRRMPPFIRIGERYVPSLGIAAALAAGGFTPEEVVLEGRQIRVRDRVIPLVGTSVRDSFDTDATHEQLSMLINYRASAEGPSYAKYEARFLMHSEDQLLRGETPDLDPAVFKDKIVFIGTSASGAHDVFQTPYGGAAMPGIQVHAAMADSLLSNRFLRVAPTSTRIAAVVLGAIAVGLMGTLLSFGVGAAGTISLAAGWTWFTVEMFRDGLWVDQTQPVAAMAIALFGGTAYRYFVEDREKRKVKRLFGRYVSKDVYDQLLLHPDRAELGGKRREMSVLFSDIRGFTSITEQGQPEELVGQLNEYFSRMVAIVFRHQGTVDKFVGDMVMALFGAPLDDRAHAEHAVQTAVDMVHELGELNRTWAAEGRAQLDIGIGVNSGDMIAGNIGSSSIMSYTVIGDNVNLGARLESLNKDYKTRIIISDATRTRLTRTYDVQPLGDVTVKGKSRAVAIFEIRVPSPMPEAEPEVATKEATL